MSGKGRILIVDDDPVIRHLLGSVLTAADYLVENLGSGGECIALIRQQIEDEQLPDMVFLDLQLTDMSGSAVLEQIRQLTEPKHLPVIMLSANTEDEVRTNFPKLSADRFLEKPFPPGDIVQIVESVISFNKET